MGCLLAMAPTLAAAAVLLLLFPVSPPLAIVVSTAAWLLISLRVSGGGTGTGDDRYDGVGGPFDL